MLLLGVGALAYAQTTDRSMYGVFDHVASESLSVAGVRIQYAKTPGTIAASSEDLNRWLTQAMAAVTTYFGRCPVSAFKRLIIPLGGKGVRSGNAFGQWHGLAEGMPHGQPKAGDRGLDNTPTWGRTYWGGTLFCLQADIELRRVAGNRMGFQDALRGIVVAGDSIEQEWSMDRLMALADRATGTRVMRDLYTAQGKQPVAVDLDTMRYRLGVLANDDPPAFNHQAPETGIRLAIGRRERLGDI